jgi:hypothetical protein
MYLQNAVFIKYKIIRSSHLARSEKEQKMTNKVKIIQTHYQKIIQLEVDEDDIFQSIKRFRTSMLTYRNFLEVNSTHYTLVGWGISSVYH